MNTKHAVIAALVLLTGPLAVQQALAGPLLWTVNDVSFNDGGTVSGSFEYDASSGVYSQVRLISTSAASFPGSSYGDAVPGFSNPYFLVAVPNLDLPLGGQTFIALDFAARLDDGGGSIAVRPFEVGGLSFEGKWLGGASVEPRRVVLAGGSISAVPEPASVLLMGLGIAALCARRRLPGQASTRAD